jgi:hypothetical protein
MPNRDGEKGDVRRLSVDESRQWEKKIADSVDASPLVFARADEGIGPFVLEVTNGQGPNGAKTLVIHMIKRMDLDPARAVEIARHALTDVFGPEAGAQADCDYRDVAELKKRYGDKHIVNETHDSMTVVFDSGVIPYTRSIESVRNQMADALRRWHERSLDW